MPILVLVPLVRSVFFSPRMVSIPSVDVLFIAYPPYRPPGTKEAIDLTVELRGCNDKADIAQMTPDDEVVLLHVME
jgi:hypothetical protein